MGKLLTVYETAAELGVSHSRVLALIRAGRLRAERFGDRAWMIQLKDLEAVRDRKPGRPRKGASNG